MHLLTSLNAGIAAAANGTAQIYVRGSSTRAVIYDDFEASSSNSSGADVALDAYGAATVYVNQLVDVVVRGPDGTTVRSYTDGFEAPNVEVISSAFTGNDYISGAAAVSEPTTLQAVLDLWKTNAGSPDWKVSLGGTATTLVNALGSLTGLVYNVKSPAYGATGDGVTSDQAAIQAALAAAVAAGGGVVFFPIGTYRTTSVITWDYRVHIVMVPGASIAIDHATNGTLNFTSANSSSLKTLVYGVTFKALQANTGDVVSLQSSQRLAFDSCVFGATTNTAGNMINYTVTQAHLEARNCTFNLAASPKTAVAGAGNLTVLRLCRNRFVAPAAYASTCVVLDAAATGANWVESNSFEGTTGTGTWIRPRAGTTTDLIANRFTGALSYGAFIEGEVRAVGNEFNGCVVGIECDGSSHAVVGNYFTGCATAIAINGQKTFASGNTFISVTNRYQAAVTLGAGSYLELDKYERVTDSTTPTFGANTEYTEFVSNLTVPTCTMSNGFYAGQLKRILFRNTNAGNWVGVGFAGAATSQVTSLAGLNVNAAAMKMTSWIWTDPVTPGTYLWLKYDET